MDDFFPLDMRKERVSQGQRPGSFRALVIRIAGPAPAFTASGIESSGTCPVAHRPRLYVKVECCLEADLQFACKHRLLLFSEVGRFEKAPAGPSVGPLRAIFSFKFGCEDGAHFPCL
ncbi:hypothetical protein [Litorisediminicola beolgyonensis]|uniref:SWIM-type domain-containing protein n=1 Tax=Litorisediminicola beolgyonensis TaxID=1173614 RepID=A0ABW3ZPB0_9RHOB